MRQRKKRPSRLAAGLLSAAVAAGALGWHMAGRVPEPAPLLFLPGAAPAFTGADPLTTPRALLSPDSIAPFAPAALSLGGGAFGGAARRDPLDLAGPLFEGLPCEIGPDLSRPGSGFDPNAAALAAIRAAAAGSLSLDDAETSGAPAYDPAAPPGENAAPQPAPGAGEEEERAPESDPDPIAPLAPIHQCVSMYPVKT